MNPFTSNRCKHNKVDFFYPCTFPINNIQITFWVLQIQIKFPAIVGSIFLFKSNLNSILSFKEYVGLVSIVIAIIVNIGCALPSQASFPKNYYIDLQKFKLFFHR